MVIPVREVPHIGLLGRMPVLTDRLRLSQVVCYSSELMNDPNFVVLHFPSLEFLY